MTLATNDMAHRDGVVPRTIQTNVAIIGAGPAGTATAIHLGQLGVRDVWLFDRADFPRDKTCGSGISPKGIQTLQALGVWSEVKPKAYPITGLRLVTPGDQERYLSAGDDLAAVVCLRRVFDHTLLQRAQHLGVNFMPNVTATTLTKDGANRVTGFTTRDGLHVRAQHTIVAGGSHCLSLFGEKRDDNHLIQAIMGWWDNVPFRANYVEMIFDKMIAPYYGWLFPEGNGRVNIGITYEDKNPAQRHKARDLFQAFLDKHYAKRLQRAQAVGAWKGHPVIYTYGIKNLTAPGRWVVGEAGRMTHPATAEGIYHGMCSGMFAAEAINDALNGTHPEAAAMRAYERRCRQTFTASQLGGWAFRKLIQTPTLDWLVRASATPAMQNIAAKLMAKM